MEQLEQLLEQNKELVEKKKQCHKAKLKKYSQRCCKIQDLLTRTDNPQETEQLKHKLETFTAKMQQEQLKLTSIHSIETEIHHYIRHPLTNTTTQSNQRQICSQSSIIQQENININPSIHHSKSHLKNKRPQITAQQQPKQIKTYQCKVEQLLEEKALLEGEVGKLEESLKQGNRELEILRKEKEKIERERHDQSMEYAKTVKKHHQLQIQNKQNQNKRDQLEKEIHSLQSKCTLLAKQYRKQQSDYSILFEAHQTLKVSHQTLKASHSCIMLQHSALEQQHSILIRDCNSLGQQIESIMAEKSTLHTELNNTNSRLLSIMNTVEKSELFLAGINQQIDLKSNLIRSLAHNAQEATRRLKMIETHISENILEENNILARLRKLKELQNKRRVVKQDDK